MSGWGGQSKTDYKLVPVHRLDDLVPSSARQLVLKVDTEGTEMAVLQGAANTLKRARDGVVEFSVSRNHPDGTNPNLETTMQLLRDEGFHLERQGENVMFSLPVIEAALGLNNIRSVICLGNSWTARRYPMTLHRHWPEAKKMLITIDSFATPRALWHTDPEFRRRVLAEWDKIEPYKARGFIAEWPV